jgi:long-chain acyl-CoA synthetase
VLSDDGWFATGDIGELDDSGFLRITGRKKDLIVTAGGKNVAPAVLEDLVRSDRIISQCVVIGDAKPFIACLVTLDAEELPGFAAQHGLSSTVDAEGRQAVEHEVQKAIDHANEAVSHAEAIRAFRILPGDFSIESGELTPSMKVIRPKVLARHADVIDEIYSS